MKTLALLVLLRGAASATPAREVPAPTNIRATALVRVASSVALSGSARGLVPGRPRLVVLTGEARFSGDGGLSSGRLPVSAVAIVDGSPGCVNGWARPTLDV